MCTILFSDTHICILGSYEPHSPDHYSNIYVSFAFQYTNNIITALKVKAKTEDPEVMLDPEEGNTVEVTVDCTNTEGNVAMFKAKGTG